jgi:hypothetical protein
MRVSPLAIVRSAREYALDALVPGSSWDELHAIAASMPECASSVGFECRLAGEQAVDLGFSVSRSQAGAAALGGRLADPLLEQAIADPCWRRLRDFAHDWSAAASPLATRVPFLFLEVDAGDHAAAIPVPSVFLGLDWLLSELAEADGAQSVLALDEVLAAASSLRSGRFDARTVDAARYCFSSLPPGGVLLHAGVMLARRGESLRLSVVVPRAQHGAYLSAIGRENCARALAAVIERYAACAGFEHPGSQVQLDFDPASADTRVGLTLRPTDYRAWPALLRGLVEDGLCEPIRAAGLLRWSGASLEQIDEGQPPCPVARTIEHVKLVCQEGRLAGAKAYFGATPRWPAAMAVDER